MFPGTPGAVGKGLGREAGQDRPRAALGDAEKPGNEGTGQAVCGLGGKRNRHGFLGKVELGWVM